MRAGKAGRQAKVYSGAALRAVAMPMGGIGAGQIAICGDGSLRQWQIFNNVNHQAFVPGSFFAVWARSRSGRKVTSTAKVLQSDATYDDSDFVPAPSVSDHIVPEGARKLLERLPGVRGTEFVGEYPIAKLSYLDDELPVEISMEAFSPFVPLNAKDSGLPVIVFRFRLKNNTEAPVEISVAASLQNAVGWDGISAISGVKSRCYGGNQNSAVRLRNLSAIVMSSTSIPEDSPGYGTMTLAAMTEGASVLSHWDDLDLFWKDFSSDGVFAESLSSPASDPGRTWNGAIAVPLELKSGEEKEVIFLISWYFPNRYVNWDQRGFGVKDTKSRFWLGNMYNNWFKSSLAVAEYVRDNFGRLDRETHLYRDTFYDSTLPYWLLDCVTSQTSTIRSPTCFWTEDGYFYGFEGCRGASTGGGTGGCCPLNCTHVWNYEQSLSKLFPDLERKMREVDLKVQLSPEGAIPHRTVLPLYLPRWANPDPTSAVYAVDGHCGTVLKTYREYRQSGDRKFLDELWPRVKLAMDYLIRTWDGDGDGVLDGPQWNTYDCFLHGHNSFTSGLYLAALRAAEEMAKIEREWKAAARYRELFERGSAKLDEELWNGEYYVQKYDAEKYGDYQYGIGCHSDQLLGQWWAHMLDLGYILPVEHVRKALESVFRYNWRRSFVGHRQQPRVYLLDDEKGLLICSWPKGGRPEGVVTLYSDEIWTGIEYSAAGAMIFEGMIDEAFEIVRGARERHDGTLRSPWNEVECGDHYVRPMSSWALLEAISGYRYNAAERFMAFGPRFKPEDFRAFFISAEGWGSFSQREADGELTASVELAYGKLELKVLELDVGGRPVTLEVSSRGRQLKVSWEEKDRKVAILFRRMLKLSAGESLKIALKRRAS